MMPSFQGFFAGSIRPGFRTSPPPQLLQAPQAPQTAEPLQGLQSMQGFLAPPIAYGPQMPVPGPGFGPGPNQQYFAVSGITGFPGHPPGFPPQAKPQPQRSGVRGGLHREAAMNAILMRVQTLAESGVEGMNAVTQIQEALKTHQDDDAFREAVIQAANTHFNDLAMSQYGYRLLQHIVVNLSSCSAYNLLIHSIIEHSFQLSRHNYGCLVVQDFLEHCDIPPLLLTAQQLRAEGRLQVLAKNKSGNHVVQRLVKSLATHKAYPECYAALQDVARSLLANPQDYLELAYKTCECRIYQKLFPHADPECFSEDFQALVQRHFQSLCTNKWANFTIQALLENENLVGGFRTILVDAVIGNLVSFSKDSYGSRVVEHFLEYSSVKERARLYLEFLRAPCFQELMYDGYANYVIQKILRPVSPKVYEFAVRLVDAKAVRARKLAETTREQRQAAARNRARLQDGMPFDLAPMGAAAAEMGEGQGLEAEVVEDASPTAEMTAGPSPVAESEHAELNDAGDPMDNLEPNEFDAICDFLRLVMVRYCFYQYLRMNPRAPTYSNIELYIRKAGEGLGVIEPCTQETALSAIEGLLSAGGELPGVSAVEAVRSLQPAPADSNEQSPRQDNWRDGRQAEQGHTHGSFHGHTLHPRQPDRPAHSEDPEPLDHRGQASREDHQEWSRNQRGGNRGRNRGRNRNRQYSSPGRSASPQQGEAGPPFHSQLESQASQASQAAHLIQITVNPRHAQPLSFTTSGN